MRSKFGKLLERAGIEAWARPFHSLRATRETELATEFPIHVVAKWIGNSVRVAQAHYLKVMSEQMEKAKGRAGVAPQAEMAETHS